MFEFTQFQTPATSMYHHQPVTSASHSSSYTPSPMTPSYGSESPSSPASTTSNRSSEASPTTPFSDTGDKKRKRRRLRQSFVEDGALQTTEKINNSNIKLTDLTRKYVVTSGETSKRKKTSNSSQWWFFNYTPDRVGGLQ